MPPGDPTSPCGKLLAGSGKYAEHRASGNGCVF
jgi:hypothetical protein